LRFIAISTKMTRLPHQSKKITHHKLSDADIGKIYKICPRADYNVQKTLRYVYKGKTTGVFSFPYYEFEPVNAKYKDNKYVLRLFPNYHEDDYNYGSGKRENTKYYEFSAWSFMENNEIFVMADINDHNLFGYDDIHFNVYGPYRESKHVD